ncbi:MAG: T9SS type A sorting domain-containing protein [Candidatus Delongbacteria bacterium]|nr:T9SS type A sorting domain-containing protein [Candidatus Delongbacteria bacterium]
MKKLAMTIILLALSITYAGTPKDIYWDVVDAGGLKYDFTAAPYDNITAKAWINVRPLELQTTTAGNIFYLDLGSNSVINFNVGNFPTSWATGDELNIMVTDENIYRYGYNLPFLLDDGDASAVFGGLGTPGTASIGVDFHSIEETNTPEGTTLEQNYPNPFNPTTTINFSIVEAGNVAMNVYNFSGQLVSSLVNGQMSAGHHTVSFDASNLSAGVYYYTLEANNMTMTNKMILVK